MWLNNLQKTLSENRWFYIPYLVFLTLAAVIQLNYTQFEISVQVNSWHNLPLDYLFFYLTHVGDGLFGAVFCILFLLFNKKHFWPSVFSFYIPAIITQLLKHFVFSSHLRPSALMTNYPQLHFVQGVTMHANNSFPSGHTTSAFAVFLFFAFISTNKKLGIIYLLIALLIGLSRIYLLQHFFQDVIAGSIVAVICVTFIYTIINTKRAAQQ